ncbi:MAG: AAA family ATPase [Lachnospiraceae bacterium]|nr:AAA family ATPase [Ruminococcus sp.]MCM1274435.1 AAA family ATPase [Lachnospiraceae bacterium]
MTIKQAKDDIKNAVSAYLTRDRFGNFVIPTEKQRPIFLMGAPGIGKTAVMEQIAEEMNIGLVSYSMTHHTRQSALGLPFIVKKNYGGEEYSVSEYTMSEIIASVYDMMELTGVSEGILFLDEINCVSETLAPAMLQFLQYKTFGRHRVPEGWVVVTAGNPPEYNNSVREFDIVTWDRLKRIDVEPNYEAWKEYAYTKRVHTAIITYLDIKRDDFYRIETTVDGKTFATARGWSDLSEMIKLYELKGFPVGEQLIGQYLQNRRIAKGFAVYYDLFCKYKSDYQVDRILEGNADGEIAERAKNAKFDERLSLVGLILDGLVGAVRGVFLEEGALTELMGCLKTAKFDFTVDESFEDSLTRQIEAERKKIEVGRKASNMSEDSEYAVNAAIEALYKERAEMTEKRPESAEEAFALVKADFDARKRALERSVVKSGEMLSNAFKFCDGVFDKNGQELLILVTELTISPYAAHFIGQYGCKEYFEHNKGMLFFERKKEILSEIEKLGLD